MIPRNIGRYEIKHLLGSGGIGHVYAAQDQELGRMVAIKALRPEFTNDKAAVDRFRAEAASLAPLNHPNITTLYDLIRGDNGELFMVMELVPGHTLQEALAQKNRLDVRECLAIVAQTAAGLSYAHSQHVIHRDIKPANLMLMDNGLLKIMDFGIARVRGAQRMTQVGSVVATLEYAAPEQIKGGGGDDRSDLYSLACVIYEMLSGDPPFVSKTEYDLMTAQISAAPPPLRERIPGLDQALDAALMRALAKNPDERFATVTEFSRTLGADAVQADAVAIVREQVVATMSKRSPAATRVVNSAPIDAPRSGPAPVVKPETLGPKRASKSLPHLVLGGVLVVLAGGLFFVAEDFFSGETPSGKQIVAEAQPNPTPAPAIHPPIASAVPQSSMIMPEPDAKSPETNSAIASVAPPVAPPSATPSPVSGAIAEFSADGWPVINGQAVRLAGVDDVQTNLELGLLSWINQHGGTVACSPSSSGAYQCKTTDGFDVSAAMLANGAARATPDAPDNYRKAEQQARAAQKGLWQ